MNFDKESKSRIYSLFFYLFIYLFILFYILFYLFFIFLVWGWGGHSWNETKNPNLGFFLGVARDRRGRTGYRARRWVSRGVRAIILISDKLYYPYTHYYNFRQDILYGYLVMA